jgi:hypothetical protein
MSCICKPDVKIVKTTVAVRNGEFVKRVHVKSPRIESHPTVFFPSATVASYRPTFLIHDNSVSNKSDGTTTRPSLRSRTAHPTAAAHPTSAAHSTTTAAHSTTTAAHSTTARPSHRPDTTARPFHRPDTARPSHRPDTTARPSHRPDTAATHRVVTAHPTSAVHSTAHPTVTHSAHHAIRVITQSSNLSKKTSSSKTSRELLEKVLKMQHTLNRSKAHPYESKSRIDEFKEKKEQVKELKLVGPTNAPRTRTDAVIQGRREWENPKNQEQLSKIFDSREEYVHFKINNYLESLDDDESDTDSDWSDDD